jgi:hypothetical protein
MRTLAYVAFVIVALTIACVGLLFPNEVAELIERMLART